MQTFIALFAFLSILLPVVHGHGFISQVTVDGKTYRGNAPGAANKASAIRQINTINPIKGAKNAAINCGSGARPASQTIKARAGSSLSIRWSGGGGTNWPHNTGPMMLYAARCSGSCTNFNSESARWFKVDQVGKQGNKWVQQQLLDGGEAKSKIPTNLAPGNYLFRHEILGLHLANARGGAEFYSGCFQTEITGSGTGAPSANELVSLPGAYSDNDPGILVNAFGNGNYVFPGPPVSKLASRSASLSANVNTTEPEAEAAEESEKPDSKRPRTISRVMRDIQQ